MTPLTDESTGYRYYDEDELGSIMQIHRHRQWGFSVKDISALFHGLDQTQTQALFAAQVEQNEAEMRRLEEANRMLRERMKWYGRFSEKRGRWEVLEPFHYQEHCSTAPGLPPLVTVADQMKDNLEAFSAAWVRLEGDKLSAAPAIWGLLRFDRAEEALPRHWDKSGHACPGGSCLVLYHPAQCRPKFDARCVEPALAVAREEGLPLAGEAYCLHLNNTATPAGVTENYALVLPLKSRKSPSSS